MAFDGIGIYCWFRKSISPECKFFLIKELGFECISLWWGDEYNDTDGSRFELIRLAKEIGLDIRNAHAPYRDINDLWGASFIKRKQIIKDYAKCLNECAIYNIKNLVIHVDDVGFVYDAVYQPAVITEITELVKLAEQVGVKLVIENYTSFRAVYEILTNVQSNSLGFCYDSGHEYCFSREQDFLGNFGNRLIEIHLHDNFGKNDQHMIPGDGDINWNLLKDRLKKTNYTGPIFLEVTDSLWEHYQGLSDRKFLQLAINRARILRKSLA